MSTKADRYKRLVKEVSCCTDCDKIKLSSRKTNEIIELEHDTNRIEINLWSHWQGNLDAKILVIGQDWGRLPNKDEMPLWTSSTNYPSVSSDDSSHKSPTDDNLTRLFTEALNINAVYKNDKLFFTNSILCYKTGKLSGKTCGKWYKQCNEKYIVRLIDIIRPKIIIAVGVKALKGLRYCGTLAHQKDVKVKLSDFKALVENDTPITLTLHDNGYTTVVFPVYHCGSYSQINRPYDKQLKDWQRIEQYIN